jgi:hypothetical protein
MFKSQLRAVLFVGIFALIVFVGAAPSEAQCYCYHGASCGVPIYQFPCGGTVCGSDYKIYKCNSGVWQNQGTSCSCSVAPEEQTETASTSASLKELDRLYSEVFSPAPLPEGDAAAAAE